jgi:UDP-N-acetylmuramoyl-tripeptide--D-alanyl-D-alanine ligase
MTHASEKSFNNQWGVPLTLARMPAEAEFAVFEIGMNHRGEIAPLARMIRPHIAVITTVEPVHIEYLGSLEEIAEEKSDIFVGLEAGGTAVIKRESPVFHIMEARAQQATATVRTFGFHPQSSVRCAALAMEDEGSTVTAAFDGHTISYRLAAPGVHLAENSLAVVAVLSALEVDIPRAIGALAHLAAPAGRGARTTLATADGAILIIDESYNANPASMRAALATLAGVPRARFPRRVAVLGDMLELGSHAGELHMGLKRSIDDAGVDLVFACGPNMQALFAALERTRHGHWAAKSEGLEKPLLDAVSSGDVVMIKGSLGSRMAPLAEALRRRYG